MNARGPSSLFWSQWCQCIKHFLCTNQALIYRKGKKCWNNVKTNSSEQTNSWRPKKSGRVGNFFEKIITGEAASIRDLNDRYVIRSELFCFCFNYFAHSNYFEQCNFYFSSIQFTIRRVVLERRFSPL